MQGLDSNRFCNPLNLCVDIPNIKDRLLCNIILIGPVPPELSGQAALQVGEEEQHGGEEAAGAEGEGETESGKTANPSW